MHNPNILTKQRGTIGQFMLYAGVGAIGTIGHYTTLIILVEFWALDPVIASCLGFVVGALINYILNYHFTFQSEKRHREALTKFLLVAIAGAGINGVIMYIGVENTQFNYLLVQIFATTVVLLWNFIVNKLWTFTHHAST
ncbi:MAG: GtrA family protein [Gammaproteobacteria bacterium]|nr:GtrA family protein [Gammaproteobacteria bacterium]